MQRVNDIQYSNDRPVDAAEHLATDEAMLMVAEEPRHDETIESASDTESIRVWEFDRPTVVLGRSSRVGHEVDRSFCESMGIPILRRCSGGASILAGPGCLMYSVVLSFDEQPQLQKIDVAHRYVMSKVALAVQRQLPEVRLQGICDLTWQDRKCSGNSLRVARHHVLYHGTLLHDFDLEMLSRCLTDAPRQPDYRGGRAHDAFVTNIAIDPARLTVDLMEVFGARGTIEAMAWMDRIGRLRQERYDQDAWHFRH